MTTDDSHTTSAGRTTLVANGPFRTPKRDTEHEETTW